MTAFGIRMPRWLVNSPPANCYRVLGLAMIRELNKRQRLPQYKTIDDAAKLLNEANNILVVTGAGVSTSLGIPDFRSKNTGFYSKLQERGFQEPEEVFDLHTFDEDPSLFYSLAGDILPDLHKWSPTHQFIRMIQDNGKLLRNYTQNIDNIESHAGISPRKLIQCHGSWAGATCRKCGHKVPGEQIFDSIRAKKVAKCKNCAMMLRAPAGVKRKRTPNGLDKPKKRRSISDDEDSDGQYDIPEPGIMKVRKDNTKNLDFRLIMLSPTSPSLVKSCPISSSTLYRIRIVTGSTSSSSWAPA
jgi:NAD-dependent histone deacetylase SIR2